MAVVEWQGRGGRRDDADGGGGGRGRRVWRRGRGDGGAGPEELNEDVPNSAVERIGDRRANQLVCAVVERGVVAVFFSDDLPVHGIVEKYLPEVTLQNA